MGPSKNIAEFFHCLSMLENMTSQLYELLSQKVEFPLAKSSFLTIAKESENHSSMLKHVIERLGSAEFKEKDCKKGLGETWEYVIDLFQSIQKESSFDSEELLELSKKLAVIEANYVEEYSISVKLKTLEYMSSEISKAYNIDLNEIKSTLEAIIAEEESHQRLLYELTETLSDLNGKTQKSILNFPTYIRP